MIQSFRDRETRDIYDGEESKRARRRLPTALWKKVRIKLDMLNRVEALDDLRVPPGNRLEALRGDRTGSYSIRINEQYRICFLWTPRGPAEVEVTDYH